MSDSYESGGVNTYNLESLDIELSRSQAPCHWAIRPVVLIDGDVGKSIILVPGFGYCCRQSVFIRFVCLLGWTVDV